MCMLVLHIQLTMCKMSNHDPSQNHQKLNGTDSEHTPNETVNTTLL